MGVLKAQGCTAFETALPFTAFAALSSLIGAAAGWFIGSYGKASLTSPLYNDYNMPLQTHYGSGAVCGNALQGKS